LLVYLEKRISFDCVLVCVPAAEQNVLWEEQYRVFTLVLPVVSILVLVALAIVGAGLFVFFKKRSRLKSA